MKASSGLCYAAAIAALACVSTASADVLTWTASGGGKWSDSANWSSDGDHAIPQSGDVIKILNLVAGQTYENDIEGLSSPHLEFGGSAASPYAQITGKQITLTGGWDACSSPNGRFSVYCPIVLTVQDGNPTNRFNCTGRWQQFGNVSGAGMFCKTGAGITEIQGGNTYTGGTVSMSDVTSGWLDPYSLSSGDNKGSTPLGTGLYEMVAPGYSRLSNWYVSNDVYVHPLKTKGANSSDLMFYYGGVNGKIYGTRFVGLISENGPVTFNGEISVPDGPVGMISSGNGDSVHPVVTYNGKVTAATFNKGVSAASYSPYGAKGGVLAFNHAANEIGEFYVDNWTVQCGVADAFTDKTVLYFGAAKKDHAVLDLNGFNQTLDRVLSTSALSEEGDSAFEGRVVTSAYDARLTLAGTADMATDARFDGALSLDWAPVDGYQLSFSTAGRVMGMSGALVCSNGSILVDGTNAFPNATAIALGDGASFTWSSAYAGRGLAHVTAITLGKNASFACAADGANPFSADSIASIALDLGDGATCKFPDGATVYLASVVTNGVTVEGKRFTGDPNATDATYLPQLAGSTATCVVTGDPLAVLSAKWYAQDGLVLLLDGLENAGWGVHDSTAATWKDLTGLTGDFTVNAKCAAFTTDGLFRKGKSPGAPNNESALCSNVRSDVVFIESVSAGLTQIMGNTMVMPYEMSANRVLVLSDAVSGVDGRAFFGWNAAALTLPDKPDEATYAVSYPNGGAPDAIWQDGAATTPGSAKQDAYSNGSVVSLGARHVGWAGSESSTYGYTQRGIRFYTRKLAADEIKRNAELDALRFRKTVPADAAFFRWSADGIDLEGPLNYLGSGCTVTAAGGARETFDGGCWAAFDGVVTLVATPKAGTTFAGWSGDVGIIVEGTVSDATIKVRLDKCPDHVPTLAASVSASELVVSEDTTLHEDFICTGIRFTGAYTLAADEGVSLMVLDDGTGIVLADGFEGTATLAVPTTVGALTTSAEQPVAIPVNTALQVTKPLSGVAPLRVAGGGTFVHDAASPYAGSFALAEGTLRLKGSFGSAAGSLTVKQGAVLNFVGGELLSVLYMEVLNGNSIQVAANTENFLRQGFHQLKVSNTPVWHVYNAGGTITFEGAFDCGSGGYPTLRGSGTVNMRTTSDAIGSMSVNGLTMNVYEPMYVTKRSNYNTLYSGARLNLHCANALTRSPWNVMGFLDLGGFDQTCGRLSYVSSNPGDEPWYVRTTGEIHSDEPATFTLYQDRECAGGGNDNVQTFAGRFTGAVSLVRTGASADDMMDSSELVLAAANTATGSISAVWGKLRFGDVTHDTTRYVGSWLTCTEVSATEKGTIALDHSHAIARQADARIGNGGKFELASGVCQRLRYLYLPTGENGAWERQPLGVYGSTESGAANPGFAEKGLNADDYFTGAGKIRACGESDGCVLIVK